MTVSYAWHLLMKFRASTGGVIHHCAAHEPISPAFSLAVFVNATPTLGSA